MNFELSEEQKQIQDMALNFAREQLAPKALDWDRDEFFPVDEIRQAAALGMASIYVDAEMGGTGLGRLEGAIIHEALAYGCPTIAGYISIHNLVAWIIDRFASAELRASYLPRLVGMDWLASYCLTEPSCGSDAAALKTRAVRDGDEWILNGTKQFISGAGSSDLYVVFARTGGDGAGGISAIIVENGTPGMSFGAPERKMGWNAQPTRNVIFEDCRVPAQNLIGREGDGFKYAMAGLDGGRINIAACSLGAAWSAIDKTIAYMRERTAFGQPIEQFQALQFRLADMATELDSARLMTYRAAAAIDNHDPRASQYSAMAKRYATDAGFEIVNQALQLHGGYGYLKSYGLEKLVRDLRVHQILEGTNEIMRLIISRKLLNERN